MSYSGLFNDNNPAGYSLLVNKAPSRNRIRHMMNKPGFREIKELFATLIGANAGGIATATYSRIKDEVGAVGGGLRTIETVTDINRATTAADVIALKEFTSAVPVNTTFVADLSGNGGGASS